MSVKCPLCAFKRNPINTIHKGFASEMFYYCPAKKVDLWGFMNHLAEYNVGLSRVKVFGCVCWRY